MVKYFVDLYPYPSAYMASETVEVESREAGFNLLSELRREFKCATLRSDNPKDPIIISRNHPNPYCSREREAATLFELKDPSWINA